MPVTKNVCFSLQLLPQSINKDSMVVSFTAMIDKSRLLSGVALILRLNSPTRQLLPKRNIFSLERKKNGKWNRLILFLDEHFYFIFNPKIAAK
jgi:hypothetical protein